MDMFNFTLHCWCFGACEEEVEVDLVPTVTG